ncbi:hypothetical protein QBC34DRAFT_842 [Podospora aff. communis PSN243]|uniref:Uncharacterized protein n=1 Tax=Podospora aff. communis PSN243 TaxID=3040156 RepID=A0AAV9H6V0_9PEZI|nr:hypothetical protein QBC34DRAFT_842 [Podospora aff. communis PSN243]
MVLFQAALTKPGRQPSRSLHSVAFHFFPLPLLPYLSPSSTLCPSPSHRLFSAIRSPSYNSARSSLSPISSSSLVCLVFLIKGPLTKKRQPQRCGIDWSRSYWTRCIETTNGLFPRAPGIELLDIPLTASTSSFWYRLSLKSRTRYWCDSSGPLDSRRDPESRPVATSDRTPPNSCVTPSSVEQGGLKSHLFSHLFPIDTSAPACFQRRPARCSNSFSSLALCCLPPGLARSLPLPSAAAPPAGASSLGDYLQHSKLGSPATYLHNHLPADLRKALGRHGFPTRRLRRLLGSAIATCRSTTSTTIQHHSFFDIAQMS